MTYSKFLSKVKKGEELVILDDYILDISKFMDYHPGGRFSIQHNIGRDISRFFHGCYALENFKKVPNHTHTSDARKIVNQFIIGRLENLSDSKLMKVTKVQWNANQDGNIKVFQFEKTDLDKSHITFLNPKCPLIDLSSISKHYLVKSTSHRGASWFASDKDQFHEKKAGIKR